jgi:hypothetical protein
MSPKIPGCLVAAAFLLEETTVEVKKVPWLQPLGRSDWFQWSCATFGAVALSYGIFLSLYGLSRCPAVQRRVFATINILGLLLFVWVVGGLIGGYVVFSKIASLEAPNMLPKLVKNSQTADSEAKREKMAKNAYLLYGVTLIYRMDDGTSRQYQPTGEDTAFQRKFASDEAANKKLKDEVIGGQLRQMPFLIAMNLGIFILTFLVGTLWLAWRRPPVLDSP